MKSKYTKEMLEPVVMDSNSIAQVISKLGLKQAGGSQAYISRKIKELDINTDHFKGQAWNKGKSFPSKYPISEYLDNSRFINSNKLKKRLIKEGYLEHKCSNCLLSSWMDKEIPIELHHIDGNHLNNNLSNLEILCPNCHALSHK